MGPQASFENVNVVIGGSTILADIRATAPAGSATVLIGPNGAGKTTLLHCLLGEIPYSGQILFTINGQPMRPKIGYVPQTLMVDANLPLRVYEFLSIGQSRPLWLGVSAERRARASALLALVDGEKLLERRVGALSGGELRRVLLALALGRNPDLLVLDEAEAGVDWKGERMFWQVLTRAREKMGFTLIMVSHNLPLCAHYATNVICIRQTVLAQGAPAQTLDAHTLLKLFGAPIHLYPAQCDEKWQACGACGAFTGEGLHQDDGGTDRACCHGLEASENGKAGNA